MSKILSVVATTLLCPAARAVEVAPFQAELSQSTRVYLQPLYGYDTYASTTDAEFTTGLNGSAANVNFGAKLVPWLRVQSPYAVGGDQSASRAFFEAKEAWVEAVGDNWDLRAGNQILSWGSADIFNPTDVWNSYDFTDPLEPAKLPATLIKLAVHPVAAEHVIIELVASPLFRPHRLPIAIEGGPDSTRAVDLTDSRWLVPTPSVARLSQSSTVPITYHVTGTDEPTDWQAGGRLRLVRLGNWDTAASFSETTLPMPAFDTRITGQVNLPNLPIDVTLVPSFYRVSTVGLDVGGVIGPVGVRIELAERTAMNQTSSAVPAMTYLGDVGFDYTLVFKKSELYFNVLYLFETSPGYNPTSMTLGVPNFEPWDQDMVLEIEDRIGQKAKLGFRGIASFVNQDGWVSPYASYVFADRFTVEVGVDLFGGQVTGAYGQYHENDRARSLLTYKY